MKKMGRGSRVYACSAMDLGHGYLFYFDIFCFSWPNKISHCQGLSLLICWCIVERPNGSTICYSPAMTRWQHNTRLFPSHSMIHSHKIDFIINNGHEIDSLVYCHSFFSSHFICSICFVLFHS